MFRTEKENLGKVKMKNLYYFYYFSYYILHFNL